MYAMIEFDEYGFTSMSQFPIDEYSQEMYGCDEEVHNEMVRQDSTPMNSIPDWNENDFLGLCNTKELFPLGWEIEKHNDDDTLNGDFPDSMGDLSDGSHGPETQSNYTIPDSVAHNDFAYVAWESTMSAQPNIPPTSGSQPYANLIHMREETPPDTLAVGNNNETRKRRVSIVFIEDDDEQERQSTPRPRQSCVKQKRSLACPYRKLDPHRHRDCLKYTLHRIKDVRQHIDRRHREMKIYCRSCYAIFPSQAERDKHTGDSVCDNIPRPDLEGVTDEQREKLNRSSSRNMSLETQWFNMWDILFPGQSRPQSAFSGNYFEEVVSLIRECWDEKGSELIDSATRYHGNQQVDKDLLKRLMGTLFTQLEEEACSPSPSGGLDSELGNDCWESQQRATKRIRKK